MKRSRDETQVGCPQSWGIGVVAVEGNFCSISVFS
jgi:hypothetical protein